jgi:hypothetical protein
MTTPEAADPPLEPGEQSSSEPSTRRRPASVTYLTLGVLTFAGINLVRFIFAFQQRDFLDDLLTIPPIYLSISGFVWLVVGVVVAAGLWFGKRWAALATLVVALAYTVYYWIDRLLFTADGSGYNWLFSAAANLLGLVIIYWMVSNPKAKIFFGDLNDR